MILVDTNILIDIFAEDPIWKDRSLVALRLAKARDALSVNEVVYAELAPGFPNVLELDLALDALAVATAPSPKSALFLAGHAFRRYRRQSGTKTGVLPDFFIGAHAVVEDAQLLTRDARRIQTYFPTVGIISP
ncbi:MAG TPA: type II toxin-antitoxin system VapC family toxin [Rhizomicrobium sp.]|jgi:predicted nucleic acid-binding protein|nr:type II toxin-antitoxin system VapC family toxin [Bryobacteraceae bacterium]HVE05526.1 type II toxin-antitoxin system VapC family toxin [Rhizomicrobium sp.]